MTRGAMLLPVGLPLLFGALMMLGGAPLMMVAVVGAVVAVAIVTQPLRGLLLFALLAPAVPWMKAGPLPLPEALLVLTWAGVAIQWLGGRLPAWPRGRPERLLGWLALWALVPMVAGQLRPEGVGIGPLNWARWVLNLSPVFLLPLLVRDERTRDRLMLALLLGFAGLLVIALGFFAISRDPTRMTAFLATLRYPNPEVIKDIFYADPGRMPSPWIHPNSTGAAMLLAAPLGVFYAVVNQGWRRWLGAFVFVAGTGGIVFSGSRGALLCLGVFVAWLAWRKTPYAGRGLVLAILLAVSLLLVYPPAQKRFASLFSSNDVSTGVRFDEYTHFPGNALRYPLGLGFKAETPASSPEKGVYGISNLWLNYWFKLGLPGMLLFIAVTLAWWREVRLTGDFRHVGPHNALRIATTGTVLAALGTGFIDHYFSFTQVLISLFWLILAMGLMLARTSQPASIATAKPLTNRPGSRPVNCP
ncbi:MAG: O-antigen ligase family protein [Aquabacterium sp.]|jgi:polysaccharide biosynthesis protein PslJ|uniref:O-antigen ligase family protein n=1 Tax=Aquabacterium sp. TaxID=1872578 RepID=UPI003BB1F3E9